MRRFRRTHRSRGTAAGAAALALALGGCTPHAASGGGTPSYVTPNSTVSGAAVTEPTPDANLKTLLQRGPTAGSAEVGSFVAESGRVWIDFSCVGGGTAKLSYQPAGAVDIPCTAGAVNATRNQVDFPAGQVTFRVQTSDAVQWSVLIQQ